MRTVAPERKKSVAVVGGGIGGVSAAYHLAKKGHEVTLLEAEEQIGGHTYAIDVDGYPVDVGFMMFGDSNPNIKGWFKSMGITKENGTTNCRIPMSLSVVSDYPGDFNFSSRTPFVKLSDLFNLKLWRLIIDIFRFTTHLIARMPMKEKQTTDEWKRERHYSDTFYRIYFYPFVAILWTIPLKDVMELPATQFLRCLKTHAQSLYIPFWQVLLGTFKMRVEGPKHLWWYIGSKYKAAFQKVFKEMGGAIRCNARVKTVERGGKKVVLETGETLSFDHVILATHPDTTAEIISWSKYADELRKYRNHTSTMYLHRDARFMAGSKKQWASWNVRITKDNEYILTYWMNRLQKLPHSYDIFVTIIPKDYKADIVPEPSSIIKKFYWDHPRLLADCIPEKDIIQEPGITLSGAWLGRGFHEDGFVAGRRAARIVDNPAAVSEELYQDPDNLPIPPVSPSKMPWFLSLLYYAFLFGAPLLLLFFIQPYIFDLDD